MRTSCPSTNNTSAASSLLTNNSLAHYAAISMGKFMVANGQFLAQVRIGRRGVVELAVAASQRPEDSRTHLRKLALIPH